MERVYPNMQGDVYMCPGRQEYFKFIWRDDCRDFLLRAENNPDDPDRYRKMCGGIGRAGTPVRVEPGECWTGTFVLRKHYEFWLVAEGGVGYQEREISPPGEGEEDEALLSGPPAPELTYDSELPVLGNPDAPFYPEEDSESGRERAPPGVSTPLPEADGGGGGRGGGGFSEGAGSMPSGDAGEL